ncbi:DUF58 domain-containing protein [Plantactinospora endophytica]|uniref:DUF58 domain-containing protein n=1 Tax=Plantactinospora endophytica TaxID=673535 RepID=A0ABQ4DVD9_9ACTN|nr:DUF58 domain-containing protein [Plantactinospora endophytica]GIG86424.1 hypothetical protein Pen02_13600 [Plantactinospora endophytica]
MATVPERLLRRLEWRLRRRLDGRLQGAYRTVWQGSGIDFTDLRAYTPEDDVRHIDWNVTARLDEPYVRQYTEDRELTAWLVVDRSASMRFGRPPDPSGADGAGTVGRAGAADGSGKAANGDGAAEGDGAARGDRAGRGDGARRDGGTARGKEFVATELAVALGRLVAQGGNRLGAILYDNHAHRVIPPRTGRDQVLRIAHELLRPPPAAGSGATTDLAAMLRLAASTTARRRSLVFVVSDFIGDPGWERPLAMLTHRHEVVVIRVVDPAELELPDLGLILVEDAETGEQLLVDTSDPLLRGRLAAEVDAREDALAERMRRAGVDPRHVSTDQDLLAVLVGLAGQSGRGRR